MKEEFKRINFFKGFFTQAEDWQAAQKYHLEKRKVHNRFLHTPGVVHGCLDNLSISASEDGGSIFIAPGYAIDGAGFDLYVPRPDKLSINPQNYDPPATVYVVIRYGEEEVDPRPHPSNPEYSGHAFIKERPELEITKNKPDNHYAIELARIRLSENATRVKDAEDENKPGLNDIDMRFVKKAGATMRPVGLEDLGEIIRDEKIRVVPSTEIIPSEEDTNVLIEKIKTGGAHRFYLVSAYPEEEARVMWRIESSFTNDAVEYRLYFKNFSKSAANVYYQVYRLY